MARLVTESFFPNLEGHLAAEIAAAKAGDAFRPVAVIVPTRALRRRLQSVLARGGPWVNVHFFTFFTLSLWLLKAGGRQVRPTPPRAVLALLLKQVIESDLPQDRYTAYLLSYKSSLNRLLSLFSRFASYRITPPDAPDGMEKAVFSIYRAFRDRKQRQAICDTDDLFEAAARLLSDRTVPGMPPTMFLYGFYDLNPAQRDMVRLLDTRSHLTILCPGGFSGAAEEFFHETAAFYRDLSGSDDRAGARAAENEPVITAIARELFSPPGARPRQADGAVQLITASGAYGEARAVALSIIDLRQKDPSLSWRDISVIMRELAGPAETIRDVFADYSIPAVFDGGMPLPTLPEVGYFMVLIRALQRGLPRDDVVFLISSALFAWPGLAAADEPWVRENAYLLAEFAKRYRIISGKKEWEKAFSLLRDRTADGESPHDEPDEAPADDREIATARYVRAVQAVVGQFISELSDIPAEAPPAEYRDRLGRLIDAYMRPSSDGAPGIQYLKERLGTLTAVSLLAHTIRRDDCLALIGDAISETGAPSPDDIDGVFVSDVMGARLVPRRVIFLTGMNEKVFPHAPVLDPFLSDATGAAIGLRTAAVRFMEDRTLFVLTVASAGELIVTRQRSDDAGRTVAPSPFLAELFSRIATGGPAAGPPAGPPVRDFPRITATDRALSSHRAQDMRAFLCLGWPAEKDLPAVRHVVSETPFLRGGLTAVECRASDKPLSNYDGLIGRADGLMDMVEPLSAQKLETYAACPFDFFMRYVLLAREEEEVEEELDVEPRELGLIYHNTLSRLLPLLVEKGLFGPGAPDPHMLGRLVEAHVKKETAGRLSGRIPALILRARQQHTTEIVGRLIEYERAASISGFVPAYYEAAFGAGKGSEPGHSALTLTTGLHELKFVGRIDRIDVRASDGLFSVVDYKRKKGSGARKLMTDILAGRHFQLPVYLMAAEQFLKKARYRPGGGALVYLEPKDGDDYRDTISAEEFVQSRDAVTAQIGSVVDAVLAGEFSPVRGGPCRFCTNSDLCRSDIKAVGAARRQKTPGPDDEPHRDDQPDEQ